VNILLVNNYVRYGSGVDGVVRLERDALRALGHDVSELSRDNRTFDEITGRKRLRLLASCLYSMRARRDLTQLIEPRPHGEPGLDLVYVHNTVPLITGAVWDAWGIRRLATVQHLHNYRAFCLSSYSYRGDERCDLCADTGFISSIAFRCYRQSAAQSASLAASRWVDRLRGRPSGSRPDLYIANSEFTKRQHVLHGLPADRIATLHNPSEDLQLRVPERAPDAGRAVKRLTFVGSLIRPKGPYVLLDLAEALPEFSIDLIGEGIDSAALRREAERRRLDNVVFRGFLDGTDLAGAWTDSFLTLAPSLWDEPFGLVVPESYSLGIPVVTTGNGGLGEIVSDGETGLVQSFGDPRQTADVVRALWDDVPRYAGLRASARAAYVTSFTKEAFAERLETLLEESVEAKRAASGVAGRRAPAPHPSDVRRSWKRPASVDLRVLIDGHMIGTKETGNETYISGLLEGFEKMGLAQDVVVRDPDVDVGCHRPVPLAHKSDWTRMLVALPALARRTSASVVHCTYIVPPRMPCASVVTIHDLSFMRRPEMFTFRDRALLETGVPLAVRRADRIIVPSHHAQADLLDIFNVTPERVRVTYEGVGERFRPLPQGVIKTVRRTYGLDRPYILTVGNLQPRKNIRRLLSAWSQLVDDGAAEDCVLVLAGGSHGRSEDVGSIISELHLGEHVRLTGFVPDADLPALYSGARLFVFPSLYEGFGLPVLEAMACGTAVACSNATSLPEVAGDAAAMFEPTDANAMAATLGALVADDQLLQRLRKRGLARARQFTWEHCARETLVVYGEAVAARQERRRGGPSRHPEAAGVDRP